MEITESFIIENDCQAYGLRKSGLTRSDCSNDRVGRLSIASGEICILLSI